jgi:translation initiation factor IF-3
VEHFLDEGHKVKVTIMFRGREMQHPELGRRILDNVADAVSHTGRVEVEARSEGRNMTMVLVPDRKAQQAREAHKDGQIPPPGGNGRRPPDESDATAPPTNPTESEQDDPGEIPATGD